MKISELAPKVKSFRNEVDVVAALAIAAGLPRTTSYTQFLRHTGIHHRALYVFGKAIQAALAHPKVLAANIVTRVGLELMEDTLNGKDLDSVTNVKFEPRDVEMAVSKVVA